MPRVKVKDGEPFEVAMRRFKKIVDRSGLPKELRKREFHQKGSTLKQCRVAAAKKRLQKRLLREQQMWTSRDRHH